MNVHNDEIANNLITVITNLVLKSITNQIMSKVNFGKKIEPTLIISPEQKDHELLYTGRSARGMTLDSWDLDMMSCVIVNLSITELARAGPSDDV